jgi:hypothetical protein
MSKRTFHFRKVEKSRVLQRTMALLKRGMWVTTREIMRASGSTRPSSDISECRANGFDITARYDTKDQRTGARIFRYRLLW